MRILYDLAATQPTSGKYHGGGEYGKVVFRRLLEKQSDETIIGFWNPGLWMDPVLRELIEENNVSLIEVTKSAELQDALKKVDRFYSALPYDYHDLDFSGIELVVTVHGLRPIEKPTDRYEIKYDRSLRGIAKYVLKHALKPWYVKRHRQRFARLFESKARKKTIIVPSRHTKFALLDTFPSLPPSGVQVLYSPEKKTEDEVDVTELKNLGVEADHYMLLVSGGRWIKNAYRAIQALDGVFERFPQVDLQVIVAGVTDERPLIQSMQHRNRFKFIGYVERRTLESLYKNAFAFMYPSLNEGFGYPPLEAMKYGTPVLCSAVTSLPEVCGDAALYFNPYSIPEMRNRITALICDENLRDDHAKRSRSRSLYISRKQEEMLDELCHLILHPVKEVHEPVD